MLDALLEGNLFNGYRQHLRGKLNDIKRTDRRSFGRLLITGNISDGRANNIKCRYLFILPNWLAVRFIIDYFGVAEINVSPQRFPDVFPIEDVWVEET